MDCTEIYPPTASPLTDLLNDLQCHPVNRNFYLTQ